MNSLLIVYENNEWCHFVVRIDSPALFCVFYYLLRYWGNISIFIYHSLMVTCSLDALKKSSKRKEMRIKKEKVEVLQQTIYSRKETGMWKIGMIKLLALTLYLLARITLTLISSFAILGCFWKVSFQGFNLIIWNFEPSAFLSASCELFEK